VYAQSGHFSRISQASYYAGTMTAVSLPARIAYAAVALPLAGAAGFYSAILLLTKYALRLPAALQDEEGAGIFILSLALGAVLAFTASLFALTLPWKRLRKRRGRMGRIVLSLVFMLVVTLGFAGLGYGPMYDLAFCAWLTYTVSFTFVRYGILDHSRRPSTHGHAS
jgi:hypothetical protein